MAAAAGTSRTEKAVMRGAIRALRSATFDCGDRVPLRLVVVRVAALPIAVFILLARDAILGTDAAAEEIKLAIHLMLEAHRHIGADDLRCLEMPLQTQLAAPWKSPLPSADGAEFPSRRRVVPRCRARARGAWTPAAPSLIYRAMRGFPFIKMHGLGNDFVVLDARDGALAVSAAAARAIGDRHRGVGFDQLLVLEPPRHADADVFLRILNADGSEAEACGNGTRCVAYLMAREKGRERIVVETVAGLLETHAGDEKHVSVDMGRARFGWRDIPLAQECDTLHLPSALGLLRDGVATNMGNPHATFFVEDAEAIDLATLGPKLEHDPLFPDRANIGVVQVLSPTRLRFRVWERGVGITIACGSGACAALVAAHRRGLAERKAEVLADGGTLEIEWRADGHVIMAGAVAVSFTGMLDRSLLPV
jgi:diaminopimelate epimerase